ncbi:Non-specific serine/threonine protein kinase protein [Dioscorea alata]|uniref:Non-specific serine/threonine protein kinase protein n=1 Tax=Dioscorea alata TaxID=55571 RepID=A0ACB7VJE7_DIOAL|nr:Non-specific serine/threonine protein kinase protein [Dioscorea alata]
MAYGRTPFKGRNRKETFKNVLVRDPQFPGGSSRRRRTELEDLIARLLEKDPARRLGAGGDGEVRAHPFFKGVQWDLVTAVSRPPYLFEDETEAVTGPGR